MHHKPRLKKMQAFFDSWLQFAHNSPLTQFILLIILLIWSSLLPASPPSTKCVVFLFMPPRGDDSLKGHRKLLAGLKFFPTVQISWMRSSTQMMPYLPEETQTHQPQRYQTTSNVKVSGYGMCNVSRVHSDKHYRTALTVQCRGCMFNKGYLKKQCTCMQACGFRHNWLSLQFLTIVDKTGKKEHIINHMPT